MLTPSLYIYMRSICKIDSNFFYCWLIVYPLGIPVDHFGPIFPRGPSFHYSCSRFPSLALSSSRQRTAGGFRLSVNHAQPVRPLLRVALGAPRQPGFRFPALYALALWPLPKHLFSYISLHRVSIYRDIPLADIFIYIFFFGVVLVWYLTTGVVLPSVVGGR